MIGELGGIPVIVMQGRFHSYEGYPLWKVKNCLFLKKIYMIFVIILMLVIKET